MTNDSGSVNFSKKNQREMSEFLTQELMYEYYFDTLDAESRAQLKSKIEQDRELQTEINRLKIADDYLKNLKSLRVTNRYINDLKNYETVFRTVEKKIKNTKVPASLKWAAEGTFAIAALLFLLWVLPFNKLSQFRWSFDGPAILARVDKEETRNDIETTTPKSDDGTVQGPIAQNDAPQVQPGNTAPPVVVKAGTSETTAVAKNFVDEPVSEAKTKKAALIAAKNDPKVSGADDAEKLSKLPARGLLYRGALEIPNSAEAAAKITAKIEELGGRRAGEVAIGWDKGKGNYYYHFTIPEDKVQEMESFINQFGSFKASEEKHPRKIPANLRRYIFTLSEKGT